MWRGRAGLHGGAGQSWARVVMGHNNVGPEAVGPAVSRPPLIPLFFCGRGRLGPGLGELPLPHSGGDDGEKFWV